MVMVMVVIMVMSVCCRTKNDFMENLFDFFFRINIKFSVFFFL